MSAAGGPPPLERRSADELVERLRGRLGVDRHEDPLAGAILAVFGRYWDLMVERLNRVPEKHHLAFLDLLGVPPRPASSARVPLTFEAVKQVARGLRVDVPAGTRVAGPPAGEADRPVLFETTEPLELTAAQLRSVLVRDHERDRWTDRSAVLALATLDPAPAVALAGDRPVDHELWIADEILGVPELSRLEFYIDVVASPAAIPLEIEWGVWTTDGRATLRPRSDTTDGLRRSGTVTFDAAGAPAPHTWLGRTAHWLVGRLVTPLDRGLEPPLMGRIAIAAAAEDRDALVDAAQFNGIPLDLTKDFFPLGERPRFGDVLELTGSTLTADTAVELVIELTNPVSGPDAPLPRVNGAAEPRLAWEYRSGRRWRGLAAEDATRGFTESGRVVFRIPSDAHGPAAPGEAPTPAVRARLAAGHYGLDDHDRSAPSIRSVTVSTLRRFGPRAPQTVVTLNELSPQVIDRDGRTPFAPFERSLGHHTSIEIGFDAATGAVAGRALPLYLEFGPGPHPTARSDDRQSTTMLTWSYWNGAVWIETPVVDGTHGLRRSGTVKIELGDDVVAAVRGAPDAPPLHWIRVAWTDPRFAAGARLERALVNTVPAVQRVTLENELLGSSNGAPNQEYRTAQAPIVGPVELEVRELDPRPGAARSAAAPAPSGRGTWVAWSATDDLTRSGAERHFQLDRRTGRILFGDGRRGRIPPPGTNNVRVRRYEIGGGVVGNVAPGSVTRLRTTVPFVQSVHNVLPGAGGIDGEDAGDVRNRASRRFRHGDRAVTSRDYEDLARAASPRVARARCFPARDLARDPLGRDTHAGTVSVAVIPRGTGDHRCDQELLWHVRDYLDARRLPDGVLVVAGASFVEAAVHATIEASGRQSAGETAQACARALDAFLDPITGAAGAGWDWGRRPRESDLHAVLGGVAAVRAVPSLRVGFEEPIAGLLGSGLFVVRPGPHRIRVAAATDNDHVA